eukprot:952868-Rhodomonas_salina.1
MAPRKNPFPLSDLGESNTSIHPLVTRGTRVPWYQGNQVYQVLWPNVGIRIRNSFGCFGPFLGIRLDAWCISEAQCIKALPVVSGLLGVPVGAIKY